MPFFNANTSHHIKTATVYICIIKVSVSRCLSDLFAAGKQHPSVNLAVSTEVYV